MKHAIIALALTGLLSSSASAAVQTKKIDYEHGGQTYSGHLAWDDSIKGPRPGVLVVHEWWGLDDYARKRAEQLAAMGYTAFALDMYGKGKLTEHPREAQQWATEVRQNVDEWRARALAGLDVLKKQENVDSNRLAAIGYCFGGSTVLQLAYAGAPLRGVVTFHGALSPATDEQASKLKTSILVCHGAADTFIPEQQVLAFRAPLEKAGADWQMIYYAGAKHSFTSPEADKRNMPGIAYDQKADERSWKHMQDFFGEVLASGGK